jgi:predicted permease
MIIHVLHGVVFYILGMAITFVAMVVVALANFGEKTKYDANLEVMIADIVFWPILWVKLVMLLFMYLFHLLKLAIR